MPASCSRSCSSLNLSSMGPCDEKAPLAIAEACWSHGKIDALKKNAWFMSPRITQDLQLQTMTWVASGGEVSASGSSRGKRSEMYLSDPKKAKSVDGLSKSSEWCWMFLLVCFVLILSYKSPAQLYCMSDTKLVEGLALNPRVSSIVCMDATFWYGAMWQIDIPIVTMEWTASFDAFISMSVQTNSPENQAICQYPYDPWGWCFLPHIYHKINHSCRYIYHTWILWDILICTPSSWFIDVFLGTEQQQVLDNHYLGPGSCSSPTRKFQPFFFGIIE